MPCLAHFKTCRATSTCESARNLRTAWRLTTFRGEAANLARRIIIAPQRGVLYSGSTPAKLLEFRCPLRKELITDCCDLRWRS